MSRLRRVLVFAASWIFLCASGAESRTVTVAPGIQATPLKPRGIRVTVKPRAGESYSDLSRRVTGRAVNAESLRGRNKASAVIKNGTVEVPFELLLETLRAAEEA